MSSIMHPHYSPTLCRQQHVRPVGPIPTGYFVEKWGGGQWGTCAWYVTEAEAQKHVDRLLMLGYWTGLPPRVSPSF